MRAWARWELSYRRAFGLRYLADPETGEAVVLELSDRERTRRQVEEVEAAARRVQERAGPIRQRLQRRFGA
jgi:hypothetical protein